MSDIEIAQKANMKPIIGLVKEKYGIVQNIWIP
jgi:formate--tetrahydrofolate ligase